MLGPHLPRGVSIGQNDEARLQYLARIAVNRFAVTLNESLPMDPKQPLTKPDPVGKLRTAMAFVGINTGT